MAALSGTLAVGLLSCSQAPTQNTPTAGPASATSSESSMKPDSQSSEPINEELQKIAVNGALAAATWSSPVSDIAHQNQYRNADFSQKLVKSFKPVWEDIFDPEIVTSLSAEPTFESASIVTDDDALNDTSKSVAVELSYKLNWMKRAGGASGHPKDQAIWIITVDEESQEVTKVVQPTAAELNIVLD